ncbi:MAG: phosphatidylglycerophosphatase A [Anaerohalosphaera sp.]|nr:phosphatidylglycerophosphatase A [Anaerohalosphaera sp.]
MCIKRLLTSVFGLGFLPIAPGTWGSLPVPIIFVCLCRLDAEPGVIFTVMAIIAIVAGAVCVTYSDAAIKATGRKDPGEVVADELAGQAVVFMIPLLPFFGYDIFAALVGFLAFRLFDILKPWPCKKLEKLPGGLGILMDDLAAGVYALIVLHIVMIIVSLNALDGAFK